MSHFGFLRSHLNGRQVIGLKELLEDLLRLLLQLIVDEVLKSLPRDALDLVSFVFLVALHACLLAFIFHLLINEDCGSRANLRLR